MEHHNQTPVTEVFELTCLPKLILPFIERYDTMRIFRTLFTDRFSKPMTVTEDCLQYILNRGTCRSPEEKERIRNNLKNPNKKYDFAGFPYESRRKNGLAFYSNRSTVVGSLFFAKTQTLLINISECAAIATHIASFATGVKMRLGEVKD